jgi:hypothetical protein
VPVVATSTTAALAPLILVGMAFVAFCLVDIARAGEVRYLPKWGWVLVTLLSIPIGGVVYLLVGRRTG